MHRFTFVCLIAILAALPHMQAAPAPKRTNATPAVIKAGTETNIQWIQERVISCAHIAIHKDKIICELAIVRSRVHDPNNAKELVSWLEKNFRVERVKDKNLVSVSFQDGNAKEQAAIINLVVDDFLKKQVEPRRDLLTKTVENSRRLLTEPKIRRRYTAEKLAKAEEALKKREEEIQKLPALVEHAKAP